MRYFTQDDKPAFIRAKSRPINEQERSITEATHNDDLVSVRPSAPKDDPSAIAEAQARKERHCLVFNGEHSLSMRDSEGNLWAISLSKEAQEDPWYNNGSIPDDAQLLMQTRVLYKGTSREHAVSRPVAVCYTRVIGKTVVSVSLKIASALLYAGQEGAIGRGRLAQAHPRGKVESLPPVEKSAEYRARAEPCRAERERAEAVLERLSEPWEEHAGGNDLELRYTESRPKTGKTFPRRKGTDQKALAIVKR